MANCGILLNDGTSFLLLNDGTSFLLLNDNTCDAEPGGETPPVTPPVTPPAVSESGGGKHIEETLRAFAIGRRREMEEKEIQEILAWEADTILKALKELL